MMDYDIIIIESYVLSVGRSWGSGRPVRKIHVKAGVPEHQQGEQVVKVAEAVAHAYRELDLVVYGLQPRV